QAPAPRSRPSAYPSPASPSTPEFAGQPRTPGRCVLWMIKQRGGCWPAVLVAPLDLEVGRRQSNKLANADAGVRQRADDELVALSPSRVLHCRNIRATGRRAALAAAAAVP